MKDVLSNMVGIHCIYIISPFFDVSMFRQMFFSELPYARQPTELPLYSLGKTNLQDDGEYLKQRYTETATWIPSAKAASQGGEKHGGMVVWW